MTNAVYLASLVNSSGSNVTLSGGVVGAGTGVAFPATQNPSSDANTLDDYEEGTWTPSISSGLTGVSYAVQTGYYTKIGAIVHYQTVITVSSSTTNASQINISGLPFTSNGSASNGGGSFGYLNSAVTNSTTTNAPLVYVPQANTIIQLYATNGSSFTGSSLAGSNPSFYISGFYQV
jgi:hypothetical protein